MSSAAGEAGAVLALDGVGVVGTVGFFLPAAVIVALVIGAVVRDRRRADVEQDSAR